jgi:predicted phage terminase large subunit-like protein
MTETPLLDALKRARDIRLIEDDRERLPRSLHAFVKEAFPQVKKNRPFVGGWHIEAICAHLEAVSLRQIERLQIWIPPGCMKSMGTHVFWPAWEWTQKPGLRYWCASHSLSLVWMHCEDTVTLMKSEWYQDRWGDQFELTTASKTAYANNEGGTRFTTAPKSDALGRHGDRIILDDLLDANDAEAITRAGLEFTNDWYDSTIGGRKETSAVEVLIMQRLHENDIAAHALEVGDWEVLCLPERFEEGHDFAWRGDRVHPLVAERLWGTGLEKGDPRKENDLIWPAHRDEKASSEMAKRLGSFKAAGQLQQRPAAKEGLMLLRQWWRFYDPTIRARDEWAKLPVRFSSIVISVDTPLKDKESSDNVAIQCWGVKGADRYLLDLRIGKMNYASAKRQIKEMAQWARKHWPSCYHAVLVENAGYGVELIVDLKPEISGIQKISPGAEGNKVSRAEAASDALESGNCFLPGIGPPHHPVFEEAVSPADIVAFVANCALFPNAAHDDDVDAWSQAMNWIRGRALQPARWASALTRAGR